MTNADCHNICSVRTSKKEALNQATSWQQASDQQSWQGANHDMKEIKKGSDLDWSGLCG